MNPGKKTVNINYKTVKGASFYKGRKYPCTLESDEFIELTHPATGERCIFTRGEAQ
jgi:hypothetical protein